MKRRIDKLGRLVIPSEMRKELGIELEQEVEIDKMDNKIVITNPNGIRSKEEIEQMLDDIKKLQLNEYNKGFTDALQMVLQRENRRLNDND